MSEEVPGCEKHPTKKSRYLTTHYTPHIGYPVTLSVAVMLFLCDECGQLYSAFLEIPRGYLADGTISPEMQKEIEQRKTQKEVDQKVKEQVAQMAALSQ